MDLFTTGAAENKNLLPEGGEVFYYPTFLDTKLADHYFTGLKGNIDWKPDEIFIFGKHLITKRETAWYGDRPFAYTYSRMTKEALPWTKELLELRELLQNSTGTRFNSCLLNLYHSGEEGMSWHSDDEKPLGPQPTIASLSLGASRKFSFKNKQTKQTRSVILEHGSLLLMKGATQENWLHSLPKTKKVVDPRINLTFRTFRQ